MTSERDSQRSRAVPLALAIVAVLLLGCAAWVGIRSLLAYGELQAGMPLAARARSEIVSGDGAAAGKSIAGLADHADAAAKLTSDPVFRATEVLPVLGPNLTALREIAGATDRVATEGLVPLAGVAGSFSADALTPAGGAVELDPIIQAAPALKSAEIVLQRAVADARRIDTSGTLDQVTDAVSRFRTVVEDAASALSAVATTSELLPAMLGADEDRNYLFVFQNNAEVRASGGLPGALALVSTSGGRFALTVQATANDFPRYDQSVLPLDAPTTSLYSSVGRFMQNVNFTPDFPTTATLAAEMWRREHGTEVDGVIALDPVVLGYLLDASGPVTLSTGDVLDTTTAVKFLLSDAYAKYPDPDVQDIVFADAARSVFTALSSGDLDAGKLIAALVRGSEQRRILLWNSRPAEQHLIADTVLAGTLPTTNDDGELFGVFFNDAGGAKMDYYLDATTTAGRCDAQGAANYRADVELVSSAPADAAESLPAYVTANGFFGVQAGTIRTRVLVYGPVGSAVISTRLDGKSIETQVEKHLGRGVAQFIIDLIPGQRATVSVELSGTDAAVDEQTVRMTPLIRSSTPEIKSLDCGKKQ